MDTISSQPRRPHRRRLIAGVLAAATIGGIVAVPLAAGAQHTRATSKATLQERKVGKYGEVVTNSAQRSLYVLSTESKGKLHCTSSCTPFWKPLVVAKNAKITAGSGVKGKMSHVIRGTKWQVTYNGWPLYTFVGDTAPGQWKGEKVSSFGGIWYLVRASATTNAGTQVKSTSGGGGTTTTIGGYGY